MFFGDHTFQSRKTAAKSVKTFFEIKLLQKPAFFFLVRPDKIPVRDLG